MNPKTPAPANFIDPERMAGLSPFKAFNTASFGVEGTAMASFAALSEEQRWQVAFYVMSLRFSREQADRGAALIQQKKLPAELTAVANLATDSDEQLSEQLKSYFDQEDQVNDVLAYLRRGLLEQKPDPLVLTRNLVRESAALYAAGEKKKPIKRLSMPTSTATSWPSPPYSPKTPPSAAASKAYSPRTVTPSNRELGRKRSTNGAVKSKRVSIGPAKSSRATTTTRASIFSSIPR